MPVFVEEVLRLESPVQGLLREAAVDVELHGVTIPAGSVVNLRYAAANPTSGSSSARRSSTSSARRRTGTSRSASARTTASALARRELLYGFRALVDRIDGSGSSTARTRSPTTRTSSSARSELHVGFRPAGA